MTTRSKRMSGHSAMRLESMHSLRWKPYLLSGILTFSFLAFSFSGFEQVVGQELGDLRTRLGAMSDCDFGECRWTEGFWFDRQKSCIDASVPQMWQIMSTDEQTQFLTNFKIASGDMNGRHRGPAWNDGDFYKWLEAASLSYSMTKDPKVLAWIDESVGIIRRAQRDDGYINTPIQIRSRNGDTSAIPFSEPLLFELYNFGHLMTAACVHHQATGSDELLQVAIRAADYLDREFRSDQPPLGRTAVCPSHYMGLIQLGRQTKDVRYIRLAKYLIDRRDAVVEGTDDNQDRIPLRQQESITGHAVRANYLYAGVADLLAHQSDEELLSTLTLLWEDLQQKKIYITGGCGALFDGASPDGSSAQKIIGRTHQAYGRPYQLPNSTAHNESCATIGGVLWNWRMLSRTGKATYADAMERALYNGLLATISLDGSRYFYTNTLRQLNTMPVDLRWSRTREPFISCYCCPPNIVRTILNTQSFAYSKSEDSLYVHLYGSNALKTSWPDGSRLKIQQTTNYPWDGKISFVIEAGTDRAWKLKLRIPDWCKDASISINGQRWTGDITPGSYCSIDRRWNARDRVELNLPMTARWMEAHPLVEETRNQVAVQRGPLVYCMESTDVENQGISVMQTRLLRSTPTEGDAKGLPSDLVALRWKSQRFEEKPWDKQLYRETTMAPVPGSEITLIPYFAWGNRGRSEMSVWLPRE